MTETDIEIGRTYRFKNTYGEITESTVISFPKSWMVRFKKPNGNEHEVTKEGFIRAFRLYGIESTESAKQSEAEIHYLGVIKDAR